MRPRVADRAASANVTQGVILVLCFLGGSFLGSPAARCILAVPLAFSKYCMERCATWQRSACVMIVFTIVLLFLSRRFFFFALARYRSASS